jgi:hypothetical protein
LNFPLSWVGVIAVALFTAAPACSPAGESRRTVASYDPYTRKMLQLSADQNGDGQLDQWTYLDGNQPIRGEADSDGDGRIDRWEYFDAAGVLTMVGSASRSDGVEDTWTMTAANAAGEQVVIHSTRRDRVPDRREYSKANAIVRVEEDTNGDGVVDKWDRYDAAVLREVAFDTSFSKGRADRRARYDAQGRFVAVELDPDGDGVFVSAPGQPEPIHPGAF